MATATPKTLECSRMEVSEGGATISQAALITVSVICGLLLLALLFALLLIFTGGTWRWRKPVVEEPLSEYRRRRRTAAAVSDERAREFEEAGIREMGMFGRQIPRSGGMNHSFSRGRADGPIYGRGPIPSDFRASYDAGVQGGVTTRQFHSAQPPNGKPRRGSEREREEDSLNDMTDGSSEDGGGQMRRASRASRSQVPGGERM